MFLVGNGLYGLNFDETERAKGLKLCCKGRYGDFFKVNELL